MIDETAPLGGSARCRRLEALASPPARFKLDDNDRYHCYRY